LSIPQQGHDANCANTQRALGLTIEATILV
jgi:hypothetical protein